MDRLAKLKELEEKLRQGLDECDTDKLPSMARQYRETLREIDEIEGLKGNNDDISSILQRRQTDGKPGAVRKKGS